MMQALVDYSATIAAWIATLVRLNMVLRSGRQNRQVVSTWLFMLFFSLFATLEIDAVYLACDRLAGVNNLSWLLSSLFIVLAVYSLCAVFCPKLPRWMPPSLFVTSTLLVAFFFLGPAHDPESFDQVIPSSVPELLFVGVCYGYAGFLMGLIPARALLRAYRNESNLPLRIRTGVIWLAVTLSIAFYVTRFALCLYVFFVPAVPSYFVRGAEDVTSVLVFVAVVLWPLGVASHEFYLLLVRLAMFWRKVVSLQELAWLKGRLERLCPPLWPDRHAWWDQLRNPDLYVYKTLVAVLDGRRMLACAVQGRAPDVVLRWDGAEEKQATDFHRALQDLPELEDFERLVDTCQRISKRTRRDLRGARTP